MNTFAEKVISLFEHIHPLDRIARAGFVLRGVAEPESVAAHSHFVSLLTLLFTNQYPEPFDQGKALAMALVHDLPEAKLMDIPMPAADAHLAEAKTQAEQAIIEELFAELPAIYAQMHQELLEARTPEARLVRGLDKAQMMLKILVYQHEGRGRLEAFWHNPKNFQDYGIQPVSELFDAICARAGKPRPR